ncbi:MAG: M48 family metalloprotease [Alphaproteobacteria bacterium]|nr:M48 family metalloprotease [Alphaproteobacteria bacterium]
MKKALLALVLLMLFSAPARALNIIRDTEIETTLLSYIRPIFKAAGLNPDSAKVVVVNDSAINAFVAGGQTIFVHTGLILKARAVDDLVFVLAHETGHIAGGHVTRGIEQYKTAQTTALISAVMGGLLAVASGSPDAGIAVMMGGTSSAEGLFTAYRQTEESATDRTAVDIVGRLGYSMAGFTNIMDTLARQERLNQGANDAYFRTHPMTQARRNDLARFLAEVRPETPDAAFDLVKAKLSGFLDKPAQTLAAYRGTTAADKYAQSIALYRSHKIADSLKILDDLIAAYPDNPYFVELKAQFLFETGRIPEAVSIYARTAAMRPDAPLIALTYAHALLEAGGESNARTAADVLTRAGIREPDIPLLWKLLSTAYYRLGKQAESQYALAEYHHLNGQDKEAKRVAKKAIETADKKSAVYQKLQDIIDMK